MDRIVRIAPILLIVYIVFLVWLSLSPASMYSHFKIRIPYFDKLVHFSLYVVLSVLILVSLINLPKSAFVSISVVVLSSFFFGLLMEILQFSLPYIHRSFEYGDLLSNFIGAVAGTFLSYVFLKPRLKQS